MKKVSGDNIPPNDVLIVGQRVSNGCVMTVMRTLGETREPILPMHLMAEITFQGGGGDFVIWAHLEFGREGCLLFGVYTLCPSHS